ncbi:MAG: long-chain-acyl-CoA synthetase [Myxococcaceae bacterium]|nr:long-chain-acyl-CoA synthetase [Myxococcaceae bacterium]
MSRLEQVKSRVYELQCLAPVARHLVKLLPNMPFGVSKLLDERVASDPNSLALAFADERYTWRDLDRRANQYARFFQSRGIGQGDVVALLMDNRPDFVFIFYGLAKLRAVTSLINTNLAGATLTHAINVCKPKAVLVGSEHANSLREVIPTFQGVTGRLWFQAESGNDETPPELERINDAVSQQSDARPIGLTTASTSDAICFIYTSGTTGLPKAAIITNKRWIAAAYLFGVALMQASSRDIIYLPLPLYHSNAAMIGLGSSLVTGAGVALRRKFSASQFWSDVRKFDASIFIYIGELCRYLLNHGKTADERNHRLRLAVGNGLRPDIWEAFQRRFGVPLMREFYAATEGNAPIFNFEGRPGMLGRLRPGQTLVRCDETTGEILRDKKGLCFESKPGEKGILLAHINPLFAFDGYVDAKATQGKVVSDVYRRGDRYFNSGDILQLHEDKWVSFADRIGDTFRWKGENVSTNEVAEVINGVKGVLESNVYGVSVPGSEGRAGMASISATGDFDIAALGSYVCSKLPAYQRPYFVRVQKEGGQRITGTFKHQKVAYRDEGFDPKKVQDPLFFLNGDQYVPIDDKLFGRLQSGELRL